MELAPPKLQQYLVDGILARGAVTPNAHSLVAALLFVVLALAATRVLLAIVNWVKGVLANKVGGRAHFRASLSISPQAARAGRRLLRSPPGRLARQPRRLRQRGPAHPLATDHRRLSAPARSSDRGGCHALHAQSQARLYTLIPAPLVVGGSLFFWRRIYPNYYRYWDSSSKQAGTLSGMLQGIRVVKAFAQEPREFDRFHRSSDYLRRSRVTVERATTSFTAIMALIFSLGGLIVWYVGGRDVLAGKMTLGSLMAFLAYLAMFYAPLSTLSQLTTWLTSFMTGCQRVFELLDTPIETNDAAQTRAIAASSRRDPF